MDFLFCEGDYDPRRRQQGGDRKSLVGERAQQFHRKGKNSQTDIGIKTLVRYIEKGRIRRIFDNGFEENKTSLAVSTCTTIL